MPCFFGKGGSPLEETIEWTPAMSVGVPLLDEQHQRIVSIINYLVAAKGPRISADAVDVALVQLRRFVDEHFRDEELILEECGYPALAEHRQEHREYRARLAEHSRRALGGEELMSDELVHFVREWWEGHILGEDRKYCAFLSSTDAKSRGSDSG